MMQRPHCIVFRCMGSGACHLKLLRRNGWVQVLIEGKSKKGEGLLFGRTEGFQSIQVPCVDIQDPSTPGHPRLPAIGDFVDADIIETETGRLEGKPRQLSNLVQYFSAQQAFQNPLPLAAMAPCQPELQNAIDAAR